LSGAVVRLRLHIQHVLDGGDEVGGPSDDRHGAHRRSSSEQAVEQDQDDD
jgi:hypothetical protein